MKDRIITIEPTVDNIEIRVIDHVLCMGNALYVFTNVADCQRYIKSIARNMGGSGIFFTMGSSDWTM